MLKSKVQGMTAMKAALKPEPAERGAGRDERGTGDCASLLARVSGRDKDRATTKVQWATIDRIGALEAPELKSDE